ncbi:MAG: serine/threonine-protein kinase, partial [Polyangiaceae bacterium]
MAAQVVAAHAVGTGGEGTPSGGYIPPPPQPLPPAAPPPSSAEDASDVHMIALRVGVVVNGRYEIIRIVGRGGMGSVYEVKHTNTGERLALKLLHPALAENEAAVERFRTEARAPVRIASDHVVRIIDADISGELGDVPFIVMEYLDGVDLRGDLRRRGAIPAGEVSLYLGQVARALDKAHEKNIVHRDLKPANLHVQTREDGSPLVKVLDFGIAKLTDDAAQELTMAGQVFGTPWYMAPEQARGDLGAVGPATDRWALGLIAFQLLTGRNYWTADGMAALIGQICYEPMAPPTATAPHLGPLFDIWFARACNRDPQLRFDSSKEMIAELARALGIQPSAAGITTGAGFNADSSLQIQVSSSDAGQLGAAIPGTVLSARPQLDSTDAPLYTSQLPNPGRAPASNTLAVLLGVVVALVIAAASVAIYLVSDRPQVPQGPVTAKADPIAPTDSPAPKAEDEK